MCADTADLIVTALSEVDGRSLLAVFAHPDDESLACGGLMARSARLGAHVSLMCATRGEIAAPGEIRARELEAAARVLGAREVVLLDYQDGMLPWVDVAAIEADILNSIRRLRPDVVITFGRDGLYWHPDHIAIHERTTAAVAALGVEAPALYYVTMPPGRMRAVTEAAAASAQPVRTAASRVLGIADVDAYGALAAPPTLVIDVADFAVCKLNAIRCHRSQLVDDALARLSDIDAVRLLGIEHFHRAEVGSAGDAFIERFAART